MHSIIVVPPAGGGERTQRGGRIELASGEVLPFGRDTPGNGLKLGHEGVPRIAGEITAHRAFWILNNLSDNQTYVVENPEGAGEHIKVGPGRIDAPVPFEFSRVVLPAGGDLLAFEVWAPRHTYRTAPRGGLSGPATAPAFALDRTKRYYAVLAALCEPRLRGEPHAPVPTVDQIVERLRHTWPSANRSSVYWNIDYLAVKLRLKRAAEEYAPGLRVNGKKESLVSLALRFDLVREEDLVVLGCTAPEMAP
ncbi:FHA domain-containing protein [Streptomyces sp. TRM66268-LWL]|uniref:FHA domain-containing protein n=1 Tax=Streptomyces polyasparticus TaxID=2767826 RepID=A0ABR7SP20_9ACTN|nr:FHA domain-containing protein [Streptomyces polyasparticus]MBC9717230.1 FHA domain-containing protein [Streptomyces polyasparticus]